jgi:alkyl hydroperoxide reductase 1
MTALTPGSAFPADVTFTYIAPTGTLDLKACGLPTKYDASKGMYIHPSPPPPSNTN